MNNKKALDVLVVGFALFSMFFGAGNLLFPPYLGLVSGDSWIISLSGFILTDIILALVVVMAAVKFDGDLDLTLSRAGKKFARAIIIASILCIGPLLAIPRNGATTYEMGIAPILGFESPIAKLIVSIVFFGLTLLLTIRPSKVVDIIGKFLTPALIIILAIVIVKGVISPIGEIVSTDATNVLSTSLLEGYQTMDALAALLFAGVITSSIIDKGYKGKEINSVLLKASIIAVIGLAFVYGGLTYIGAHTVNLVDANISNTSLLVFIAGRILGTFGVGLIGAAIGLACLTTSIGLLTAGSTFFEKVTNGKLSYKFNAIAISIMSYIIACQGVDKIVKLSVPILNVLYPVAITIIIVTMFNKILTNIIAIRLAVYTSLVFGLLFALFGSALNFLPLASVGFGWVIPTLIALVIGCFIKPKKAE